jgi:hypothetical protein
MDDSFSRDVNDSVGRILRRLVREQEDLAANLAATTPYWQPCPPAFLGHMEAAAALRGRADLLDASGDRSSR